MATVEKSFHVSIKKTEPMKVSVETSLIRSDSSYKGDVATIQDLQHIVAFDGDYVDVFETNSRWQYIDGTWTDTKTAILINPDVVTKDSLAKIATSGLLADAIQDETHRVITDEERTAWNAKQNALMFDDAPTSGSTNPVKSSGIKTALDAKANNADLATIAKSGKLSDATEDATHRVVTDTEKATWNAKQDKLTFDETPTFDSNNPVTSNGIKVALDKKANFTDIPDVSQFITRTVNDLVNYYTSTVVDSKVNELKSAISSIPKFSIVVVSELPTSGISETTVYLLKTSEDETGNLYTEYIYVNNAWESLGTQTVDLSGYVTTEQLNAAIINFLTEAQVSSMITEALKPYALKAEIPDVTPYNEHIANKQNPHEVTAAQVGAYIKPADGIPEADLSADVQNKLSPFTAEEIATLKQLLSKITVGTNVTFNTTVEAPAFNDTDN